jgi:predicted RNA-binding protein with EMAP domain
MKLFKHYKSIAQMKGFIQTYEFKSEENKRAFEATESMKNDTIPKRKYGTSDGSELPKLQKYIDQEELSKASKAVKSAIAKTFPVADIRRKVKIQKQGQAFLPERYFAGADKCFAKRSRGKKAIPTVTLVAHVGYAWKVDATEAKYNGLHVAVIAGMLQNAGYAVRVIAITAGEKLDTNRRLAGGSVTVVKEPQEQVDVNRIALALSDPRFFRYFNFMEKVVFADSEGKEVAGNLGTPPSKPLEACKELASQAGYDISEMYFAEEAFSFYNCLRAGKKLLKDITQ